tara:strand:- start:12743 stop:13309 length:567 start_codon:yes stop_codon:yes gene_type:complete
MTTVRQRQANSANAQRSSGPKSAAGKRRVSQNARRHGLTTPLPWDQVTGWYRIILGDGAAKPDFASRDLHSQAALRLAEAEAHLARVVQAERDHLFEMQTRLQQDARDMPRLDRILARLNRGQGIDFEDEDVLLAMAERLSGDPALAKGARLLARVSPTRPAAMQRTLKTLTRYRREAEGARKTALNA